MNKKCICFCRVSTQQQDLVKQSSEIQEEAKRLGYNESQQVIIEHKESGISLSLKEREGISELKQAIETDSSINCVICWELSRIGRKGSDIYHIRDFLKERNIQWVIMKPYMRMLNSDGMEEQQFSLMLGIFTSLAEMEMTIKKERFARGKARSRELGKYTGGTITYGYSVDKDKKWIINEEEAKVIRFIFDCYETGSHSLATISRELQELGYFTNTTLLSLMNKVNRWLKQPIYNGSANYPVIITTEQYERVQKVLTDHKNQYRLRNVGNMLCKRLLINKKTGYTLCCKAKTGLAKGTNERSIYVSDHRRGNSINILQHAIDPVVWECAKILYQKYMMDDIKVKRRQIKVGEELKRKFEVVEQEISKVQGQIDKLEERIILGKISSEKSKEISKKLTNKLKSLEKDRSKILYEIRVNLNKIKEYLSNPNMSLESLSFKEQYDIVHKVIDKVLLSKPDPHYRTTIAEIYSKVDNKIYVYKIRTKVVHWELVEVVEQ